MRNIFQSNLPASVALLLTVLGSPLVLGADPSGNYAIWGVGRASCHQFLKATSSETPDKRFTVYLMGYLTAFNTLKDDTYNITGTQPLDESLEWIGGYCDLHQMDSYDRAIQQLIDSRFESRHTAPPGRERGWGRPATPTTSQNNQ